ncbi:unnamed protein product [Callosobruchus maculatus]|uniref:Glycosyltransferase 2-like domain-containing protein n=1 Tax=Callosobruchus maculatus TaxID=64391 RepID=A0A653C5U4_CALMS|nr:unnamed protein product [Callosobruchus maculatus]
MLYGKLRIHTCRVILLTSLVWFLIDVVILSFYSECLGGSCRNREERSEPEALVGDVAGYDDAERAPAPSKSSSSHGRGPSSGGPPSPSGAGGGGQLLLLGKVSPTYAPSTLRRWRPAPPVLPLQGRPGERGRPVKLPPNKEALAKEKFKLNQFNVMASDSISLNRSLQDVRLEGCKDKRYPPLLPTTSIVIVFHNEAWSTLLRTVWSAINRSPRPLLKEIILVDDASERDYLGKQLEEYVSKLPVPTYVYRTEKRSGLIRARLLGAKHVTGQVITFLDAHCECTEGWLEPLLARISEDRGTVVCPIIDVISDDTFEYITASDMTWGGFNWKLNFRWYRVPQREMDRRKSDRTAPLRTPTMAGGLFSIDKEFFYEIGSYDEGMDIWGGENLEMSFRIWQCGGTLELVPCSRVGHVFRSKSPYSFPGGSGLVVLRNTLRVVNVWLDDWTGFYYALHPDLAVRREAGDNPVFARGARVQGQVAVHVSGGRFQDRPAQRPEGGRRLDGRMAGLLLRHQPRCGCAAAVWRSPRVRGWVTCSGSRPPTPSRGAPPASSTRTTPGSRRCGWTNGRSFTITSTQVREASQ